MKSDMNETMQRWRHRAAHYGVTWLSTRPALYYGIRHALRQNDGLCVSRSTELVIEGFPRSANSTTVHGFMALQDRPVALAHHKHHAAQILRAVRWGIPAVVLVHEPADTVVSLLALAEENRLRHGGTGRGNALTFSDATWAWLCFYQAVLPLRDKVVFACFQDVTSNLSDMINEVNMRWGTSFRTGPVLHSTKPTNLGWHALPNATRSSVKRALCDRLKVESQCGRLSGLLARCNNVYQELLSSR